MMIRRGKACAVIREVGGMTLVVWSFRSRNESLAMQTPVCEKRQVEMCVRYPVKKKKNVSVCYFVHKNKFLCLSVYVKRFHVYLLFDPCCDSRRSSVIVCNEPSRLGVDLF